MTIRRTAYCHFENFFKSIGEAEKGGCEEMIYIFSQPLCFAKAYPHRYLGRAIKRKRPDGQAGRLTSPDLRVLCRTRTEHFQRKEPTLRACLPPDTVILSEAKNLGKRRQ